MYSMRKLISVLLAGVLAVSLLAGCGGEKSESLNGAGNISNGGLAFVQGDRIYYSNGKGIQSVKPDGSGEKQISEALAANYINVVGDRIYYKFVEKNDVERKVFDKICSIKTDGSDKREIIEEKATHMTVVDDRIYYAVRGSGIFSIKTDGGDKQEIFDDSDYSLNNMVIAGKKIYYIDNGEEEGAICSMNLDGTDRKALVKQWNTLRLIVVYGDRVYYASPSDGIYSIKTNGSGEKKISDDQAGTMNVARGRIYYSNSDGLYSMKIDGKDKQTLSYDEVMYPNIAGNRIFYTTKEGIYSMNLDGTDKGKLFER